MAAAAGDTDNEGEIQQGWAVQVGVDDESDLGYRQDRAEEGEAILAGGSIPAVNAFLCNGAPGHLRLRLWMAALGHTSSHTAGPGGRFEALCQQVELRPLFTDILVRPSTLRDSVVLSTCDLLVPW